MLPLHRMALAFTLLALAAPRLAAGTGFKLIIDAPGPWTVGIRDMDKLGVDNFYQFGKGVKSLNTTRQAFTGQVEAFDLVSTIEKPAGSAKVKYGSPLTKDGDSWMLDGIDAKGKKGLVQNYYLNFSDTTDRVLVLQCMDPEDDRLAAQGAYIFRVQVSGSVARRTITLTQLGSLGYDPVARKAVKESLPLTHCEVVQESSGGGASLRLTGEAWIETRPRH